MDDYRVSGVSGCGLCDYVYCNGGMVMIEKTYTRVVNTLLKGTVGKPQIVCWFRDGKLLCGTASKHKMPRACVYRKFLRIKRVGI